MSDFLTAIGPGALVTLAAIAASVAAVLILFVGFCVVFNLPKLRFADLALVQLSPRV